MDKVIELPFSQEGCRCWMCFEALSMRARFCNHCGCIQPVREMDHFQRLGLPRSVDIDLAVLEKQFNGMQRSYAAERFAIRSHAERSYAQKHLQALQTAYDTLRDPLTRSRYWLDLHAEEKHEGVPEYAAPPLVAELQAVLEAAREAMDLDRLAQRAGQEIEFGIVRLLARLRQKDWQGANEILSALDGLETLITEVRAKRQAFTQAAGR